MEPIPSSSGVSVQPDERLGDPGRFDYLVVVGGLVDVRRLSGWWFAMVGGQLGRAGAAAVVPLALATLL